jgi:hypothetical protein
MIPRALLNNLCALLAASAAVLGQAAALQAQEAALTRTAQTAIVPPLIRYSAAAGNRAGDIVEATFRVYAAAEGGDPLWTETQQIAIGSDGNYSVLLGGGSPQGIPASLFADGQARWMGVSIERAPEQGRSPLVSAAYALKAADAESLAGRHATDFVTPDQLTAQLAAQLPGAVQALIPASAVHPDTSPTGAGVANAIPRWTSASNLGDSALIQSGTGTTAMIGVNVTPTATLDVNGTTLLRSNVSISTGGTATASAGVSSPLLAFEGATLERILLKHQSVPQAFAWQLIPTDNNTLLASSNLSLLYGSSAQTATPTGLSIGPSGVINFASGQTFPGTVTPGVANTFTAMQNFTGGLSAGGLSIQPSGAISFAPSQTFPGTITSIQPGFGLTAASIVNGVATFSVDQTTIATLGVANTFTGAQNFVAGLSAGGSSNFTNAAGTALTVTNNQTAGTALVANGATAITANGTVAGVFGNTSSAGGSGVEGAATGSNGSGVYGYSQQANGVLAIGATGVKAQGSTYGVNAIGTGSISVGVQASGPTGVSAQGTGTGVYGAASSPNGVGVTGVSTADAGMGLHGVGHLPSTFGAEGFPLGSVGIWADDDRPGDSVNTINGAILATADNATSAWIMNHSSNNATEYVYNWGGGSRSNDKPDVAPVFRASGPTGDCLLNGAGESICTGTHKAAVPVDGGNRKVAMYAVHAAENWFEDFGTGQLVDGAAVVRIDPVFAETINGQVDYQVFLTPRGDCEGLYVSRQTATSFEVHELRKGVSSVGFNYRITARRAGHETERMADETEEMRRDPRLEKVGEVLRAKTQGDQ